jgi:hypothetical protein
MSFCPKSQLGTIDPFAAAEFGLELRKSFRRFLGYVNAEGFSIRAINFFVDRSCW